MLNADFLLYNVPLSSPILRLNKTSNDNAVDVADKRMKFSVRFFFFKFELQQDLTVWNVQVCFDTLRA